MIIDTDREIVLDALPWPALQRWDGTSGQVEVSEVDVSAAELRAAVDAAPSVLDLDDNRDTIEAAITGTLARLQQLIDAPDVPEVPAGTLTTAQLSNALRAMRTAVQQNRDGAQEVAQVLKRTIRLVRGDFTGTD